MKNSITEKRSNPRAKKQEKARKKTAIDFCGVKLTALRREFIINYVTPGQPCFHNALQSAIKAGYKKATAESTIYIILQDPDIQKIIRTNEALAHQAIHESAMRALELKQQRAFLILLNTSRNGRLR
jgi:phage terminase small subunit